MKFNKELNISRGIGIFLVILGHSFPTETFNNNFLWVYIHKFIYSFHMPLFFFLSGFFAFKIYDIYNLKQYKKFICKKFKRLMIPYFLITLIAVPIKLFMNKFAERPTTLNKLLMDILIYPLNNPIIFFWFLHALFLVFLIAIVFVKMPKKYMVIITCILSLLPFQYTKLFNINGIIHYGVYFYIGLYIKDFYKGIKIKKTLILPILALLIGINFVNTNSINILNLIFLTTSMLGIYLCVNISYLIKDKNIGELFNMLGDYSYDIFLISWFFQTGSRIVFYQMLHFNYNISILIMFISGFLPILLSKFILRKSIILSELFLGRDKKENPQRVITQ